MSELEPDICQGDPELCAQGGDSVIACCIVFAVLCTLVLGMRFGVHWLDRRPTSLEDWILIPAWVLMMGLCTNVILSVKVGGVGRHEEYLKEFEPKTLTSWAQTLFVTELLHAPLIALEKSSILLLYRRLFSIQRWFRVTTLALIVYIWLWALSEWLVAIVQCIPVEYQWNKKIPGGHCINQLAYFRWICLPNMLHDVAVLLIPTPIIWKLQTGLRQKMALSVVFVLGSFGCVASLIRMYYFFNMDAFSDKTWASIQLMAWTVAEPGVILICACLPALWPLLQRFMSGIFSLRRKEKYGHGSHSVGNKAGTGSDNSRRRGGTGTDNNTTWSVHAGGLRRSLVPGTNNDSFVPLGDAASEEERRLGRYEMGSVTASHERARVATLNGNGIHVTRIWAVVQRPPTGAS
ncbi:hypothetical protein B0H66DRAFT_604697 [Apodospora peruviana]|uniref:Rhodopsin domain-containing protein n=1 Tax=Apodospora peruviana TaxID=516989 RepID=A0AAE0I0R6_9PEZI|nr:hypothetical protein B0H66DRAFT_604697 [Apodospora peruviana]